MKKCVIIDDEQTAVEVVKHLALHTGELEIAATFNEPLAALAYLNQQKDIAIVFLDIHLPKMSGFAFLEVLKTTPKVILTTSDKNLALTAYDFDLVVDYLVKPMQKDRFIEAINRC